MKNNYIKKTLKNGVKLYLYIDKNMVQTYVDYMIDYGHSGKYFDFYYKNKLHHVLPGCAHFLEHLLGEHSKYGNIYKLFYKRKYNRNGTTSMDITHYYFLGVNDIKDSIEKLINAIDDPVFTKEDIVETSYAIAEETKRTLNSPGSIASNIARYNLYKNLNLVDETLSVIGNENTTNSIDYETLKLCYDAFYYDENKTLLIAGNFDEAEMTEYIESIYAKLKPHKKEVKLYNYKDIDKKKKTKEIKYMSTHDDIVNIIFKQKNHNFSKKEIVYFLGYISSTKFLAENQFIRDLKKDNIITDISRIYRYFLDDENYNLDITFMSNNTEIAIEKIIDKLKINDFNKRDFDLYFRVQLSYNVLVYDNVYSELFGFAYNKCYTEDFNDIVFIKQITFDRFIEFYNSLSFDDYTIGIVKDNIGE